MARISINRLSKVNPNMLEAGDYGLLAQNMPLAMLSGTQTLGSNGLVYVAKLRTRKPILVSNVHLFVTSALATPTAGQNFAALYSSSKTFLAQTADQSTAWQATGMATMALSSSQTVPAGIFYVAVWANATTRPGFRCGATGTAGVNGTNSAANSLWATADTSITTTGPATLGTFTAYSNAIWAAVS